MTMTELRGLPAPAKLNLFLHVTGRRPDGMHLLQSVFMLIDWQDTLDVSVRTDGRITRSENSTFTLPADDLCTRAARALQQASGCRLGAHLHLHKSIPAEAGMGGGSSDAATTLLALNQLWNLRLAPGQLAAIGLGLGADVPFFLGGHTAWVEGVGEQLVPVELPRSRWIVVKPAQGVPTARIFAAPDLRRDTPRTSYDDFVADPQPLAFGRNDLQPVAARLCPEIGAVIDWLRDRGLQPRMTGSGSAVFAALPTLWPNAHDLIAQAPPDWAVRICHNLDRHPVLQFFA